jgi:hypothetical protein
MQARKYIRFDSTQELLARAISAKGGDYRIIARARSAVRSRTRTFARNAWPRPDAIRQGRNSSAQWRPSRGPIPALPLFSGRLRRATWLSRTRAFVLAEPPLSLLDSAKCGRSGSASVSNRNGARACRNRIFLHRRDHIFVVERLQTRAMTHESLRESSDSAPTDSTLSQSPRRFLSASLTACGLALPPVDFIT